MTIVEFLANNKWILLFYLAVALAIYLNRKKFDMQGIVALKRTKIGLKAMDSIARKYGEFIKILGYIGIGIGYLGMILIGIYLIQNLYALIFVPETIAGVSLVIPGLNIPGSPFHIPLINGWIALFLIITVHEFSHGVVARAHGLKVKSSGILFLGPIMGAFVEPDEKEVKKKSDSVQYSIFAAGPFSNIVLAVILFVALLFLVFPAVGSMTYPAGFSVSVVQEGYPASNAGLKPNELITEMNGIPINSTQGFIDQMTQVKPNQTMTLMQSGKQISITPTTHPDTEGAGYIGVKGFADERKLRYETGSGKAIYAVLKWMEEIMKLTIQFSLGIGLINLLPVGPVDGGRMLLLSLQNMSKDKKKAMKWFTNISIFFLAVLVMNLIYPMFW